MADKAEAFVKGGCGCLAAFFVLGLSCLLVGGSVHIDVGGVFLLFVIGGVIGLIVLAIYNKGRRDAQARARSSPAVRTDRDVDTHRPPSGSDSQ
jgi:hypothetical protein